MRISDWSSEVCSSDLKGLERTEALIDAECDLIVVDTAHGHSKMVSVAVERIKKLSNSIQVVAGNVANAEAGRALIGGGGGGVGIGIGPGWIGTQRRVGGRRGGEGGVGGCGYRGG